MPAVAAAASYSYLRGYGCDDTTMLRFTMVEGYLECQELCTAKTGCRAFTYTLDAQRCYLKTTCRKKVPKSTNLSGESRGERPIGSEGRSFDTSSNDLRRRMRSDVLELAVPKYVYLPAKRCSDSTFINVVRNIGSSETCKAICNFHERCRAFTYATTSSDCHLQQRCSLPKESGDSFSGLKQLDGGEGATVKFDIVEKTTCTGNDYEVIVMDDLTVERCAMMCATIEWCRSFNLNSLRGMCSLKRWGGDMEPSEDIDCGVMVDAGEAANDPRG
jgi:hypothetical protein